MKQFRAWTTDVFSNAVGGIIAGVVLLLLGLWWFNKDKSNEQSKKNINGDSVYASQPKRLEQSNQNGKNNVQIKPETNKLSSIDSINNIKTQSPSTSIVEKKQKQDPAEVINNSEKADFAVIVTTNGKKDNHLTGVFANWLKASGTASQSVLQSLFIEQGYFNQVLDGNSSVIKKTNASQSAKYLCLARSTITYNPSKIDESLIVARCVYEVVIVEAATGKVIDSFEQTMKSSGISEEMAKKRVEDDFIKYLNERKLSL